MTNFELWLVNNSLVKRIFKTPWIGAYPSFQDALAAIPPGFKIGYNQEKTQEVFRNYPIDRVRPADYPILLHLRNLLRPGVRVVDVGGNIGMAYYTAQKYFKVPCPLEWVICDVPAVVETGREVASREGEKSRCLRFVTELEDAGACEIFFTSGTLQFLEPPLPALLGRLPQPPDSVLVNRIPVWDGPAFATIHDNGFCISPYHIFNWQQFTTAMEQAGYKLVDTWECPESSLSIRFRPYWRLHAYRGFYFSRSA